MKRLLPLFCLAFLLAVPSFAQEQDEPEDDTAYSFDLNQKGDQYIRISLGASFPLNFNLSGNFLDLFIKNKHQLSTGGMGTLGYHYFLTPYLAVGGDAGFGFNVTIGSNILTYVPLMVSVTYQPTYRRFEFPITVGIGMVWETYANYNYFPGLVIKPEVGIHYRLSPSWSVGGELSWMYMPQFAYHKNVSETYHGQFFTVVAAARYYF